jgi:beta-lactamase regulating signal transducer with metallopeptidase domain
LVISFFVSLVGWLIYFFFLKKVFPPAERKKVLTFIVAFSFVVPFFTELPIFYTAENELLKHELALKRFTSELNIVDIEDPNLQACYRKAEAGHGDMCGCEVKQKQNMVLFTPNPLYSNLLKASVILMWAFLFIGLVFLIELLTKLWYLWHLTLKFEQKEVYIQGRKVILLLPKRTFPAGSFILWDKNYIILPDNWGLLDAHDQEAIIMHEFSHIKQKDTLYLVGFELLKTIWWLNPIYYLLKREYTLQSELIADKFAVNQTGNVRSYAELLLRMQQGFNFSAISRFGGSLLKTRVLSLVNPEKTATPKMLNLALMTVGAILLTANVIMIPVLSQQAQILEEYHLMEQRSQKEGSQFFCKSCLMEELKK